MIGVPVLAAAAPRGDGAEVPSGSCTSSPREKPSTTQVLGLRSQALCNTVSRQAVTVDADSHLSTTRGRQSIAAGGGAVTDGRTTEHVTDRVFKPWEQI
jgi:hypothetical protein